MPHVASLIFNSIGFVSNLYALKQINSTAFENPFALGFGGQYQYLTILGLVTATIAFALKVVRYFIPTFTPIIYEVITNIATPLEGLISVMYWSLMFMDPKFLIPEDLPRIPLILDMTLHLFPAVFLWIDFLVFDVQFKRNTNHIKVIYAFALFYYVWSWYCQHVNGYWVYPFLGEFNLAVRTAFFAGSGIFCMFMYEAGAIIHNKIHAKTQQQQQQQKLKDKRLKQ